MDWRELTAKTSDEALTSAMLELGTTIENVDYEVIEKETSGFLGIFGKPAKIRYKLKYTVENEIKTFLNKVFRAMGITANIGIIYDKDAANVDVNIEGEDMGVLIGKRGQTLDSLQYLVSLVVNKNSENYIKVKLDTENYRERRKETLENLAKNIAFKVKRTRKPVSLEPMNPYERRIIHSALQNDKYVETYSEGEEPFRKVVINIKKTVRDNRYSNNTNTNTNNNNNINNNSNTSNNTSNTSNSKYGSNYKKDFVKKEFKKDYGRDKEYSKHYSNDYKKDYLEYKESKEKKVSAENA